MNVAMVTMTYTVTGKIRSGVTNIVAEVLPLNCSAVRACFFKHLVTTGVISADFGGHIMCGRLLLQHSFHLAF